MASKKIYKHHERTTTANLESDLQTREIGIDPVLKVLTASSQVLGTKLHAPTLESPLANFSGIVVSGNTNSNSNCIPGEEAKPHILQVVNDNTVNQCFSISSYCNSGTIFQNNVHYNRYNGTLAAPTHLVSGDYIMSTGYRGANDSGILSQSMAAFQVITIEDWVAGAHGCRFDWEVAEAGANYRTHAMELTAKKLKITWAVQACGYSAISGSDPLSNVALSVYGDVSGMAGTDQYSLLSQAKTTSAATSTTTAIYAQVTTAAATYTTTSAHGILIGAASKGAGNTLTTLYGLKIEDVTVGNTNYAIYTGAGLVRFGGAGTFASTLTSTGLLTATAGVSVPDGAGLASTISFSRTMIGRSGTALYLGDPDGWTEMRYRINSGNYYWYHNATESMRLTSTELVITGQLSVSGDTITLATAKTPASASATGTTGMVCWDASYVYVCTASNTWKRSAIATW